MILLLSPAKSLDFQKPLPQINATEPFFAADAREIAAAAATLNAAQLRRIMNISDALATLNAERFAAFPFLPERPAFFAFSGDVYTGLDARSLPPAALSFAQAHVRILSGLYGLLRPLDAIRPYRLEMGTRWAPGAGDLYSWWGDRIGTRLAEELQVEGGDLVLNLASKEYFAAVAAAPPPGARILTIDFRERGTDGLRFNSFAAKRARGTMARWICEHGIIRADDLKGFDAMGYTYQDGGSEEDRWLFVRG